MLAAWAPGSNVLHFSDTTVKIGRSVREREGGPTLGGSTPLSGRFLTPVHCDARENSGQVIVPRVAKSTTLLATMGPSTICDI